MNWHSIKTAPKTGQRLLWLHRNGDVYLAKWLNLYNFFILKCIESKRIQRDTRMIRDNKKCTVFKGWTLAPAQYRKTYLPYENIDLMKPIRGKSNGTGKVKMR